MTEFKQQVLHTVKKVPSGQVVSYGQVAAFLGYPRRARNVGWILNNLKGDPRLGEIPWWRVVNNSGRVSISDPSFASLQKELLQEEGVDFISDFSFDIDSYRFNLY